MRIAVLGMLAVIISGCAYYNTPSPPVVADPVVTRGEFDAASARSNCRAMARNLLQIARCDGR